MPRLTQRMVERLQPRAGDYFCWDDDPHGFGVRVWPSGRKVYVVKYQLLQSTADRRYTLGTTNVLKLQLARTLAKDFLARVRQGGDPVADLRQAQQVQTVGALLARYQTDVLPQESLSARRNKRTHLVFWTTQLGAVRLDALTPPQIVKARAQLAASRSISTANRYLNTLSAVFRVAVRDWGVMGHNPVRDVTRETEPPGRERWLTDPEREALLAVCAADSHPYIRLIVLLGIWTGARKMEVMRVQWSQVSWGPDVARLRIWRGKSRKWDQVQVRGDALAQLRAHQARSNPNVPWVFPRRDGRAPLDCTKAWYRVREATGLGDFRFHDLRHTFASYLAMSGATPREIAEALGDSTLEMAMRYSHLSPAHTAQVVTRMQDTFLPAAPVEECKATETKVHKKQGN